MSKRRRLNDGGGEGDGEGEGDETLDDLLVGPAEGMGDPGASGSIAEEMDLMGDDMDEGLSTLDAEHKRLSKGGRVKQPGVGKVRRRLLLVVALFPPN